MRFRISNSSLKLVTTDAFVEFTAEKKLCEAFINNETNIHLDKSYMKTLFSIAIFFFSVRKYYYV